MTLGVILGDMAYADGDGNRWDRCVANVLPMCCQCVANVLLTETETAGQLYVYIYIYIYIYTRWTVGGGL